MGDGAVCIGNLYKFFPQKLTDLSHIPEGIDKGPLWSSQEVLREDAEVVTNSFRFVYIVKPYRQVTFFKHI